MEIEFTSRYGTKVPSWLTACLECEAMGCNPPSRELFGTTEEWLDASFITCEACNGSARVPYYRAIARIPRWFGRSIRFVWDTNIGVMRDCRAPWHNRWHHFLLTLKVSFLADLGLYQP